jgi:tRNA pseudouridine32 synthase / 23S rRNA pseudouridine746 synthase
MVLVVNKPAGLPVHPGPQAKRQYIPTLIDYLDDLRFGLPRRPEAAHRLDKDTSGCLILGRHPKALAKLNLLFKQGKVDKTYWAIVEGKPEADSGVIDLPLGRLNPERGWWMAVMPDGLASRTRWKKLGCGQSAAGTPLTWLELTPETGRTHQLRVHCQASGWPILGDPVYGNGNRSGVVEMHLHAQRLSLQMSHNKPPLVVEAPPPVHMMTALSACGWVADAHSHSSQP